MRLADLLSHVDPLQVLGTTDVQIRSVTRDSRMAGSGVVWVAIRGASFDGHSVASAITGGVIVVEEQVVTKQSVTQIVVKDTRLALAQLSAALWGHPALALPVVGVTGTNGKTTVTTLCAEAMSRGGSVAGRIGTLGAAWGEHRVRTGLTTPEAPALHELLAAMHRDGAVACFVEVSSIALDQCRVEATPFQTVAFTNLSRDHLDFHGDMESYAASKAQLFQAERLRPVGGMPRAILCGDDPAHAQMGAPQDRWLYGFDAHNDVRVVSIEPIEAGQCVRVSVPGGAEVSIRGQLVGRFNALNLACGLALLRTVGVSWADAAEALSRVPSVAGRLERVDNPRGLWVYVDYAHTPDALAAALSALRPLTSGQVWVVFGCGGDRDAGKRPEMGKVAAAHADRVVVTSDNPRSEDPQQIIDQVLQGVDAADVQRVRSLIDRRRAIAVALADAQPGDVVLIAGKGHEVYQEIDGVKLSFDDRAVAAEVA